MFQNNPGGFSLLPPVVKNLLAINILMYMGANVLSGLIGVDLTEYLALHMWGATNFWPWQIITHMFMHGNFSHLFFNMFAVWMFGAALENMWGSKKFIFYYFFCGLGASLTHYAVVYYQMYPTLSLMNNFIEQPVVENLLTLIDKVNIGYNYNEILNLYNNGEISQSDIISLKNFIYEQKVALLNSNRVVGASGALFGLLTAYGVLFPNSYIYLFFLLPIKAKHFVIIFGLAELLSGLTNNMSSNIAHFAHIGGMVFGFVYLKYLKDKIDNRF